MASYDIGIDLGTVNVLIYEVGKGIVLREPSVIAVDVRTGETVAVGKEAHSMIGKAPGFLEVIKPLCDGVISDYHMTEEMIKYFVNIACNNSFLKPRVVICIPSNITDVETRAVVDTAVAAGARKVYIIEEPVAAAIGAGLDISKPLGNIVVDIGGGTCDIAMLSLNGIVSKSSIKLAGEKFDQAIIKEVRNRYNILIGSITAENIKKKVGSVDIRQNRTTKTKGRNLLTGLPQMITVSSEDFYEPLSDLADQIISEVHSVIEKTPPELVGDLSSNGIIMTGGGALLDGLDRRMSSKTGVEVKIADNPLECVAIGTGRAFEYLDVLVDGFQTPEIYSH